MIVSTVALTHRGCGIRREVVQSASHVKLGKNRTGLESLAIAGNSPVREVIANGFEDTRVQRDTWNPVGICEDHLVRLNTTQRPIVNKYREGKVKSTPARGVKETLKPCAYKPLEPLPAREGDSVPFA